MTIDCDAEMSGEPNGRGRAAEQWMHGIGDARVEAVTRENL